MYEKCQVEGYDGCTVTGYKNVGGGKSILVKHTSGECWIPEDQVKIEKPKKVKKSEQAEKPKEKPKSKKKGLQVHS